MATGIAPGPGPAPKKKSAAGQYIEYDEYIDRQLRRTRGQVKLVEIAGGVLWLCVGAIAFFLVAALLDHWVIRGGLGVAERVALFALMLVGLGYGFVRAILPALIG